jgi:hypothetical protein
VQGMNGTAAAGPPHGSCAAWRSALIGRHRSEPSHRAPLRPAPGSRPGLAEPCRKPVAVLSARPARRVMRPGGVVLARDCRRRRLLRRSAAVPGQRVPRVNAATAHPRIDEVRALEEDAPASSGPGLTTTAPEDRTRCARLRRVPRRRPGHGRNPELCVRSSRCRRCRFQCTLRKRPRSRARGEPRGSAVLAHRPFPLKCSCPRKGAWHLSEPRLRCGKPWEPDQRSAADGEGVQGAAETHGRRTAVP